MIVEVDNREYKVNTEKKMTYAEVRDFAMVCIYLAATDEELLDETMMKLAVVGVNESLDIVIAEPRIKEDYNDQYSSIESEYTRAEQLHFFNKSELDGFVTLRGKPMDLKKKNMVVNVPLCAWLEINGHHVFGDSKYNDLTDQEFIAAMFNEDKSYTIEEIANMVGCSEKVALFHIKELIRVGQIEIPMSDDPTESKYALTQHIHDQLTEVFAIFDKMIIGEHDVDVNYLSGRLFAVVDRQLTKQDGKGMTTAQFERACMHPYDVFREILTPVFDSLKTDKEFGGTFGVLTARIGNTKEGTSRMPKQLDKESRKMFIKGFDDMYTTMANFDENIGKINID